MFTRRYLIKILVLLALLAPTTIAADPGQQIHYDPASDRLTLNITQMPLSKVLTQISAATGIQIQMDPEADHSISIALHQQPLESSLKQLTRELNHVLYYEAGPAKGSTPGEPVVVAIKVLPRGSQDQTGLIPLFPWADEANSPPDGSIAPNPASHWQLPMDQWPEANRKQMAKQMQRYQTLRKKHEKRWADYKAKRDTAMQEKWDDIADNTQTTSTPSGK